MHSKLNRRQFISRPACGLAGLALAGPATAAHEVVRNAGTNFTISLNIYSFNRPLRDGKITISDVIDFCARSEIAGLDATGYYFPGYPDAPPDEYVCDLKRKAFLNGVTIHGTGVRTDFAVTDPAARKNDVELTKRWIDVGVKLGASEIRIFSGLRVAEGRTFDETLKWMADDIRECADYGKQRGVMIGMQNHHDFLKTADETIKLVEAVDSDWFGVKLDIGSLRRHDPYEEIEKLLPYAVSWQLKENVWYGEKEVPTDIARVFEIIRKGGFRGWLPIETLGPGDPEKKLAGLLRRVRP
jgi:sugar phosphate isomerase/epimerase